MFEEFEKPKFQDWLEDVKKSVKNPDDLQKLFHKTDDGILLNALYTQEDVLRLEHTGVEPGQFPFVSGFRKNADWKILQSIECEKILLANQSALLCLQNGADGILFTGNFFPIENELKALLKNIYLDACSLHFDFGESNNSFFYVLVDELLKQGVNLTQVSGSVNFDPYHRALLTGVYDYSKSELKNIVYQQISFAVDQMPHFRSLSVNGSLYHNAGASEAVEMAATLSHFVQYLNYLTEKGVELKSIISQIAIHISTSTDFLSSIAKLRAYRILFANVIEAFAGNTEFDYFPEIIVHDSGWSKTFLDVYNNLLRSTTQAMSAAIGGADSIVLSAYNSVKTLPKAEDYVLAKNIQLLLKEESKFNWVQDPAAGSYYIENYTNKLADKAWEIFREIEKKGGFETAIEEKYIQSMIESTASKKNEDIIAQKKVLVGVNKFPNKNEILPQELEKPIIERFVESFPQIMPVVPYRASEKIEQSLFNKQKDNLKQN